MFSAVAFEQDKMMAIFDRLDCEKLKIDTSAAQWDRYVEEITGFLGLAYQQEAPYPCDLKPYTGTYRWQNGAAERSG